MWPPPVRPSLVLVPQRRPAPIAIIAPSVHRTILAIFCNPPAEKCTVPAVVPNPVPAIVTATPGFATRGVMLPIASPASPAATQIETLPRGSVKFAAELLPPAAPVIVRPTPPIVALR